MTINGIYRIELDRFGINNQAAMPAETAKGINEALTWARAEGYNHAILPSGSYLVRMNPNTLAAIQMPDGMHLELEQSCKIIMEPNTSPSYSIVEMRGVSNAKLTGGALIGDKKTHAYEIYVKFQRGGVNSDGTLNSDPAWIRSEIIDRYANPGLLANFRLWTIAGVSATGYQFYQYRDVISKGTLVGSRTNGVFAPASADGRGWFLSETKDITKNNKMIIAVKPSVTLTDKEISAISAKIDNAYYTHEAGHGVALYGANQIGIDNVEISDCTGDGIFAGWAQYYLDPGMYSQEQMGGNIRINNCSIHNCRRQGISICGSNDVHIYRNRIYGIGYAEDGKTTDFRNGTPPMFGIDIESMVSETNIPVKSEDNPGGLELNYRITVDDNYVYNNARGHFINSDGTYVTLSSNLFEGYNIGGVGSNPNYKYMKFVNNTLKGCELWVQGDQFVHGGDFINGNLRLLNIRGAVVQNCRIKNGMLYGSSIFGYLGTPTVSAASGTFTFASAHGLGNGAQVAFEQWIGKVPAGISVDKVYYTVNATANSFQVSETLSGAPVAIGDTGQTGFNLSRYDYGRCYLSDIVVEREWRPDNTSAMNVNLLGTGMVINNLTVKNYDAAILVPQNYAGRPNELSNITLIEGSIRLEGSNLNGGKFLKAKSNVIGRNEVGVGSTDAKYTRTIGMSSCSFHNVGVFMDGNCFIASSTFTNATISKSDNDNKAVIASGFLNKSQVNLNWIRKNKSVTIASSVLLDSAVTGSAPYIQLVNNSTLSSS